MVEMEPKKPGTKASSDSPEYAECLNNTYTVDDPKMFDSSLKVNGKAFDFWLRARREASVEKVGTRTPKSSHTRRVFTSYGTII